MIALWLVSTGFAQTPEPAPTPAPADGEARAKVLFENGSQLYEEGQYEAAILAFRSALEAWPGATSLHYNLSNCHERLGQLQPAYDELNLYRATAPPEERDTIERRLRALEARMATPQPAPAPAPAPAPTPTPTPAPAQGVASSADRHPRWLLVGLGVGAMGLGGAGAGATFASSRTALDAVDRDAYGTARTLNGVSFGVGGVGLGLAVLGLGWQTTLGEHTSVRLGADGLMGT